MMDYLVYLCQRQSKLPRSIGGSPGSDTRPGRKLR